MGKKNKWLINQGCMLKSLDFNSEMAVNCLYTFPYYSPQFKSFKMQNEQNL